MFEYFIMKAFAAGLAVSIVAAVLGNFVVWRKMAYFGDSLAHSSLLGVAFGLFIGINLNVSIVLFCMLFSMLLIWGQKKRVLATDTLLGILAHSALSIGLVLISLLKININIHSYLFGDILSIGMNDIYWIYGAGTCILILLFKYWSSLVLMTLNEDLARAEGVNVFYMQILFTILITVLVAMSIRVVGVLLITSMLIIPAAAARQIAKSPESMAIFSAIIGAVSVLAGLQFSLHFDTPAGPTIIMMSSAIFVGLFSFSSVVKRE